MHDWINEYWEKEALPKLMEFGRIPNVSPAFAPNWSEEGHMDRAAEFLKSWAESRDIPGMEIELLRKDMRTPLIFIEIPGQKDETVLIYGHLDKQPPMLPWRDGLDPWKPVREGDLVYGRGLADDGYSIFAALGAVEAALKAGHTLPRVCVMIEACEESGSPDLRYYVSLLKDRIGNPSTIVTLDSEDRDGVRLWLSQSLRGLVNGFLTVEAFEGSMHSGLAGGLVPAPQRVVRMLLARLEDPETGVVHNKVINPPLSTAFKEYAQQVASDVPDFFSSIELGPNVKPTSDNLEEAVARNLVGASLEVTGLTGLPEAEQSGNITAGRITVRLSMRIAPGVDPDKAAEEMKRVLEADPPYGMKVTYEPKDRDWGWFAKPFSSKMRERIWSTTKELFNSEPGLIGIGGSIPFVQVMTNAFPDAEHIITGILVHSANAHGPNENLSVTKVKKLTEFVATFLAK